MPPAWVELENGVGGGAWGMGGTTKPADTGEVGCRGGWRCGVALRPLGRGS